MAYLSVGTCDIFSLFCELVLVLWLLFDENSVQLSRNFKSFYVHLN